MSAKRQKLLESRQENAVLLGESTEFQVPLSRLMAPVMGVDRGETAVLPVSAAVTPFMLLLGQRKEPKMILQNKAASKQMEPVAGGYSLEAYAFKNWSEIVSGLVCYDALTAIDRKVPLL